MSAFLVAGHLERLDFSQFCTLRKKTEKTVPVSNIRLSLCTLKYTLNGVKT